MMNMRLSRRRERIAKRLMTGFKGFVGGREVAAMSLSHEPADFPRLPNNVFARQVFPGREAT